MTVPLRMSVPGYDDPARAEYDEESKTITVLAGSPVASVVSKKFNYVEQAIELRKHTDNNNRLTENVKYSSLSAAASCVAGNSRNGQKDWVDEDGTSYGDINHNEDLNVSEADDTSTTNPPDKLDDTSITNLQKWNILNCIAGIKNTGLIYSDLLIKRFAFSLLTKPFVILSGLSGSGKTQLALAFAKCLIQDDSQLCLVPVGADWTNREPLLGYPNGLNHDEYIKPESGVLELLINANKNQDRPYFLILDEMNLSYVERYFADFLSAMESKENIPLWNGSDKSDVPAAIPLPKNVFIIGTINVDETTYMFSPKVLDRANVIEFKIDLKEMSEYLNKPCNIDMRQCYHCCEGMATDFVRIAKEKCDLYKIDGNEMRELFEALKKVNAEFGYRTASEIQRFITIAKTYGISGDDHVSESSEIVMSDDDIMDAAIVQKLLPKLHGSRKKLESTLNALWQICLNNSNSTLPEGDKVPDGAKYKLSADKILRMYRTACENGFTSFAEA